MLTETNKRSSIIRLKYWKAFLGITIFIVFMCFVARHDYSWHKNVIANDIQTEMVYIWGKRDWTWWKPWSWFDKPMDIVVYTHRRTHGPLNDSLYMAQYIRFRNGEDIIDRLVVYNINSNKIAYFKTLEEVNSFDPSDRSKWYNYHEGGWEFSLWSYLKRESSHLE